MTEISPATPTDHTDKHPPIPPADKKATAAAQTAWVDKQNTNRQAAIADAKQPTGQNTDGRKDHGTAPQSADGADRAHASQPERRAAHPTTRTDGTWTDRHDTNRNSAIAEAKQTGTQATPVKDSGDAMPTERVAGPVLSSEELRHDLNRQFMKTGLAPMPSVDFKPTKFEQRVLGGDLKGWYTPKYDPQTGDTSGFKYESSGFYKEVDRDGKTTSSGEKPLEKPAVDPIDVVGPGEAKLVAKLGEATGRFVAKDRQDRRNGDREDCR